MWLPTEEAIRDAQGVTGEVLWISQRTRLDLSFPACVMATMSTKAPQRVLDIGRKVLCYLQRTRSYKLRLGSDQSGLALFTDASFAPESNRSHSGWVVFLSGSPVLWRSGRQSLVSLSTAEAELNSTLEGTVCLLSI